MPDKYKKLTWFYTPEQKIVEYEESSEPNYFKSKFKDKVKLDLTNGALDIHNVQKEDSSTYLLRVVKVTGNEEEWQVPLKVFGELGEPKGKPPLRDPRWTTGRLPGNDGDSLWEEERKIPGLIHFSWSQFHLRVSSGQENPN